MDRHQADASRRNADTVSWRGSTVVQYGQGFRRRLVDDDADLATHQIIRLEKSLSKFLKSDAHTVGVGIRVELASSLIRSPPSIVAARYLRAFC